MSSIQTGGRSQQPGLEAGPATQGGVQQVDGSQAGVQPAAGGGTNAPGLDQTLAALLAQAGFGVDEAGAVVVKDQLVLGTAAVQNTGSHALTAGGELRLPPVAPPEVRLDAEAKQGAESFATNLDIVLEDLLVKSGDSTGDLAAGGAAGTAGAQGTAQEEQLRKLSELSPDQLVAAFLKLNITDPNNSVQTHNELQELSSNLRQAAIEAERKQQESAATAAREAAAYASKFAIISKIVLVVLIVVAVVASIFTFGGSLGLIPAALAFKAGVALAIVALLASITRATAAKTASDKATNAQQKELDARTTESMAEQFQKQLEEENAIVKLILESKNQTVEAVLKMMSAMFTTQNEVMAAQMAR